MIHPVFTGEERASIEETLEAILASVPRDLLPGGGKGGVFLAHLRYVSALARPALGRKPLHGSIAAATLKVARARGSVELYPGVAVANAVFITTGDVGLAGSASLHPTLATVAPVRSAVSREIVDILLSAARSAGATGEG